VTRLLAGVRRLETGPAARVVDEYILLMRRPLFVLALVIVTVACATDPPREPLPLDPLFRVERLGPIVTPESHPEAGDNIMGPSLVRVPEWVEAPAPLGRYYLYPVFWSRVGDAPEVLMRSTIDLSQAWESWTESPPVEVLRPEHDWEGANAPIVPSIRSVAGGHVNQLRDPAIFEEDGRVWLLYAIAGESGIALAELHER
jgi:hypothetical protein